MGDDQQTPQDTSQVPSSNMVMDVQAPPSAEASAPAAAQEAPADQSEPSTPDTAAPTTPPITDEPMPTQPAAPLGVKMGDKTPHEHKKPVAVIVIAIIVALILAGLTWYALKGKNSTSSSAKTTPSTSSQTATVPVKSTDVDKTSQDVDNSVKQTNDTTDLNSSDLSNTSLGI